MRFFVGGGVFLAAPSRTGYQPIWSGKHRVWLNSYLD